MSQAHSATEGNWLRLLREVQVVLTNTLNSLDLNSFPQWEIRYLLWAAVSVNQTAAGYLILKEAHSPYAAKLLIRPMLEAFLSAQAVLNKRGFLFRKIYTEFLEFCKSDPKATQKDIDETVKSYVTAFKTYDKTYPCECKKVDMAYTAKVAEMMDHYEVIYRIYCKYTHGAQIAVTGALNEVTDDTDTPMVIELMLRTLGHLERAATKTIPDLASLRDRYNNLAQQLKRTRQY